MTLPFRDIVYYDCNSTYTIIANTLPKILSKSSIRHDLIECIETFIKTSAEASLIMDAMTEYISVCYFDYMHQCALLKNPQRSRSRPKNSLKLDSRQSTSRLRYDLATEQASILERSKTASVCPPAKRKASLSLSLSPSPARSFPAPRRHEMYPSSLLPAPSSSSMPLSPPSISPPSPPAVEPQSTTNHSASLFSGSINDPIEIIDDEDDPIDISNDDNAPIEISDEEEREWPGDFFVDEVVPGLQEYKTTAKGQRKVIFERRYPGVTYCRMTVFDQVKRWKEAPAQFKDACLGGERIRWSVFVRRLKKGKMLTSTSVIDLSYSE